MAEPQCRTFERHGVRFTVTPAVAAWAIADPQRYVLELRRWLLDH